MSQTKHFRHDCEKCVYVCSTPPGITPSYDFYYCNNASTSIKRHGRISCLARYGNSPEEYLSGIFHDSNTSFREGLMLMAWQAGKTK